MRIRRREMCLLAVLLAFQCAAQTNPPLSREQLRAAWEKDWTKVGDVPFSLLADCGTAMEPDFECDQSLGPRPASGGLVFAPHLQHKVPKEAAKAFRRALGLSHNGDHRSAEAEFERAIRLDPGFAEAYVDSGIEYAATGLYPTAEARFRRAIELDPASSTAYCNLGILLANAGRTEEAEGAIRRSLELSPDNARAHFLMGRLLLALGDNRMEAEQFLAYAARTVPSARAILKTLRRE